MRVEMVEAERIERLLEPLRRRFRQDRGDIELLEVTKQELTVRVVVACGPCSWSHLLLEPVLERVIRRQVPELERIRAVQDAPPEPTGDGSRSVGRSKSGRRRPPPRRSFSEDAVVFGCSAGMQGLFKFLRVVADSESTVLITGETGPGKRYSLS